MPKLQVAIDLVNLSRSINVIEKTIRGGADWIEIGTPLIKSEGKKAIEKISNKFPDHQIVADMKTMDTGSLEVEIASKSGADIVSILGEASNETIREAIKSAKKYNSKIMVDLIGVSELVERAKEIEELGPDYILVHKGIDEQMAGASPLDRLKKVQKSIKIPLAVAGGLDKDNVADAVRAGAEILVVGGAIIRSKDPETSTRKIKDAIKRTDVLNKSFDKKTKREEILSKISTANLSDASHRRGVLKGINRVCGEKEKVFGKALTVKTMPGDWAKPVEALEEADKGDILVIDSGGKELAVWGELASNSAIKKGVKAVIIDGGVRDVSDIKDLGFPVWAKYKTPEAGEPKGYGEIKAEITCGKAKVGNGDYILADEDGIIVIPKREVDEMLNRAKMVFENEERVREEIKEGSTLSEVIELNKWEKK